VSLDPILLGILVCPEDKQFLYYLPSEDILYNPRLHRRYPIRSNIPVMLVEESETVEEAEHERILAKVAAGEGQATWRGPEGVRSTDDAEEGE
jgi:uncharacterized protein